MQGGPTGAGAPPPPTTAMSSKKGKSKKTANDPQANAKALQDKIAQLELDKAGKTEEDAEIEREVRKANREMQSMLSSMDSAQTRAEHLNRKYTELLAELKRAEREHTRSKKRADQLQKDKDTQRTELTKATALKDKLEKLSRDLNTQNKALKEDLRDVKEAAQDKNNELHQRLEQMMDDVEHAVQSRESPGRSADEMTEEFMYKEKFKSMVEQYEMREIHMASVLRTRELEIQWHAAQHEKLKKSQDIELNKSHQLTRQVSTFSQTENELRSQLNIYVEKFKQVEDTLNNSNDLFLTFRKEMEEMSKKTKRLEKENMLLTRKQEATNKNILQMAEERTHNQDDIRRMTQENEKLKKLCRAMQTNGYSKTGGGPPPLGPNDVQHIDELTGDEEGEELEETDSEYDDEDEEEYEDEDDVEGETSEVYEDATDDEQHQTPPPAPQKVYGPPPPPNHTHGNAKMLPHQQPLPSPPSQHQQQQQVNGTRQVNGAHGGKPVVSY